MDYAHFAEGTRLREFKQLARIPETVNYKSKVQT